jgi:hypothetical protein
MQEVNIPEVKISEVKYRKLEYFVRIKFQNFTHRCKQRTNTVSGFTYGNSSVFGVSRSDEEHK